MVYDVVVVENPTEKQKKDGVQEKIVLGPVTIVAKDAEKAKVAALFKAQETQLVSDYTNLEIFVRPFVK